MTDWAGILERDGAAVWRTVRRLVGDRADAEDCFQETFVSALESFRRQPPRSPRAMLLRLATARAMDRLRVRYRRRRRDEPSPAWDALAADAPGPARDAEAGELSARLRAALAELPARQAEAFCLCCIDDCSYDEAADSLGTTADAVGVLVHRARAKLKAKLADLAPEAAAGGKRHG